MKRLVDKGPHTVIVTPSVLTHDSYGDTLTPGEPVTVSGVMVQPVSTTGANQSTDSTGESRWRILGAGTWPGGVYSKILIQQGPATISGHTFNQVGAPLQYGSGKRTKHFTVTISSSGLEAK